MMKPYVIVPYRNREDHLPVLLKALPVYLNVIVVEQEQGKPFNRAKLLNIGSVIAFRENATHVITHDVDMIPNDKTRYVLGEAVHLATSASQFNNKMPYDRYFGGVTVFSSKTFYVVNGYSNEYWGWGAEDDDMLKRCELAGIEVKREYNNPFKSLKHVHALESKEEAERMKQNGRRYHAWYDTSKDGINNLEYSVLSDEVVDFRVRKVTVSI